MGGGGGGMLLTVVQNFMGRGRSSRFAIFSKANFLPLRCFAVKKDSPVYRSCAGMLWVS